MKRLLGIFLLFLGLLAAVMPFAWITGPLTLNSRVLWGIASLNLLAWCLVLAFFLTRREMKLLVSHIARQFGIDTRLKTFERLVSILLQDVERKNNALIPHLLEKRIGSKEELSRTLERIVGHAYQLLKAESAELALFDKDSGMYHSSFVLGKPFRRSAQAMLSGAVDEGSSASSMSPDVLIEPLAFGSSVLGSLRVGLRRGRLPSQSDREIMHILALQAGLAVINAQYTDELMRMRHVSEESIKAKTGFLANLSHEIRAPLGTIINAVEVVIDGLCGAINADQLETLNMVKTNGAHLLELINDVLDYAKVESGKLEAKKTELVLNDILADLMNVVRSQAEAKKHTLNFKPSDEVLTISCDRRHFRQMMINLLTNAIKYTPDGGKVDVWVERIPGGKLKISVKDTGVGIEEADRPKVFAPFERIQNAYSINQVGTGLGMPLTKRLAEVNSATVDFSSKAGVGSTFWLVFPAGEFHPAALDQNVAEERIVKGKGELILLLETDDGERKMLERHLCHTGFRVAAAASKGEALELLHAEDFKLAILDNKVIDKPDEDLLKSLRDNSKSAYMPIVLLSSRAFVFDIEKYLKAGVDRCLTKPISLKELSVICRDLIDGEDGLPRSYKQSSGKF